MKYGFKLLSVVGAFLLMAGVGSARTPDLESCDSWRPACSGNYTNSSRPGSYAIQYVVIHKAQGSAAGTASWFENCSSNVSAHFTYNNSSGYCYQSVYEADIAYHAGNWSYNLHSIGIEHGGYVTNNDTSNVCYRESGLETRSAIIYYDVLHNRSRVVGHSEVPGADHTDPGVHWNWGFYMSCANPLAGGAIRNKWLDLGGSGGVLGNPTTGELATPDTIGRYNHFNGSGGSSIYWTPSTGAHAVLGAIHDKWEALGWETGICGYPLTDETATPDGIGRYNHFSKNGSSIYWTGSTGAHVVYGGIRSKWESLGWENSQLGYPTSDEYDVAGGRRSNFQGGTITWDAATGATTVAYF